MHVRLFYFIIRNTQPEVCAGLCVVSAPNNVTAVPRCVLFPFVCYYHAGIPKQGR